MTKQKTKERERTTTKYQINNQQERKKRRKEQTQRKQRIKETHNPKTKRTRAKNSGHTLVNSRGKYNLINLL